MWAIIGGSGFEAFEAFEKVDVLERTTPFGEASSGLQKIRLKTGTGHEECLFLPRHGSRHELLPSEVNFRANLFALKNHGATRILAFSAVGSLQEELAPGDLVIPHQYVDRTKSLRKATFCGQGVVGHVSLARPIWEEAMESLLGMKGNFNFKVHGKKTYVCVEGPYFSTKAESHSYRDLGADIIGMTAFPEYALAREAGLSYLPCCFVTDYDCWNEDKPHVTLETVLEVMKNNNAKAFQTLIKIVESNFPESEGCRTGGLQTGLMNPPESLNDEQRKWVGVLRR